MQWGGRYSELNFDPSLANGEGVDFKPFGFEDISFGLTYWYHKTTEFFLGVSPDNVKFGLSISFKYTKTKLFSYRL